MTSSPCPPHRGSSFGPARGSWERPRLRAPGERHAGSAAEESIATGGSSPGTPTGLIDRRFLSAPAKSGLQDRSGTSARGGFPTEGRSSGRGRTAQGLVHTDLLPRHGYLRAVPVRSPTGETWTEPEASTRSGPSIPSPDSPASARVFDAMAASTSSPGIEQGAFPRAGGLCGPLSSVPRRTFPPSITYLPGPR